MRDADERPKYMRVTATAVIGGGMNLRQGQVVTLEQLGEYAETLLHAGAIQPAQNFRDEKRSA